MFDDAERKGTKIKGITFKRGMVRDYFFILNEEHVSRVENGLKRMMNSKWSQHFEIIQIPDKKVMGNAITNFLIKAGEVVTKIMNAAKRVVESEEFQTFFKGTFVLQNIIELGEKNWMLILSGIDFTICEKSQEEIDEYFINYIEQENEIYEAIKERICSRTLLTKKNNLLMQIFSAIDLEHYALAGMALSSTIEYILALDVRYDEHRIKKLIEEFKNSVGEISLDEDGLLPAFGLDGFLTNFSLGTNGFDKEKEPKFVNWH